MCEEKVCACVFTSWLRCSSVSILIEPKEDSTLMKMHIGFSKNPFVVIRHHFFLFTILHTV